MMLSDVVISNQVRRQETIAKVLVVLGSLPTSVLGKPLTIAATTCTGTRRLRNRT